MGKTSERRVFASAPLRYRRKVPVPEDNQQAEEPQQPADPKQAEEPKPKQQQTQQQLRSSDRSSRSPPGRRFRPKAGRQPKHQQQQPPLLKQLLWKAKAVQPTPASLSLPLQSGGNNAEQQQEEEQEEDEEVAFAQQQRQARKLLASEAEALAASKQKVAAVVSPADAFVAESSSQETQSGSEDETVFLPYNGLPTTKWQLYAKQQQQAVSPVMSSEAAEEEEAAQTKEQDELEKAAATRRKLRQKYKLKQKQKRKEQKRLQHQQRQQEENERPRSTGGDEDAHTAVDIFHPPTNLASDMDAGVCRAVLSQLKEVVPFIVVGDVACPVVVGSHESTASVKGGASAADSDAAVVDFREHVIAMLDRSKEAQMQYRDSFVLESSGFDAASSYDFFKRRTCGFVYVADWHHSTHSLTHCFLLRQVFARSRGAPALCTTNGFLPPPSRMRTYIPTKKKMPFA